MENLNYNQILSVSMILFAIIDILGSIPIVISLRNKVGHIQSEKASIVALVLMILFLFIGEEMLKIIGLDISSFAIAGSVVIFIIAMEMILGINLFKEEAPESASIVPLAFPLIAGSGTQSAGGAAGGSNGGTPGAALQGGNGAGGGAGGGGGYYGGGGGGFHGDGGYGGGGGSGYTNPSIVTSATLYIGSSTTAGNSSDADRPANAGAGNTAGNASFSGALIIKA